MTQFLMLFPIFRAAASFPLIDGLLTLSVDPADFSSWFARVGVSLGGGLSVIQVALGFYKLMTSGGDPAKVKDGKEQIQNAILGFMLIILSIAIVATIFTILKINVVNFV